MKCVNLSILAIMAAMIFVTPAGAHDHEYEHEHEHFAVGLGLGGYPYYAPHPYYTPYYYSYPTYYVSPPTVIYQQPAATEIISAPPAVATVTAPPAPQQQSTAPAPVATAVPESPSVPTYVDGKGRTCRQFQSVMDGASVNGTACLQPDGTWRTVGE